MFDHNKRWTNLVTFVLFFLLICQHAVPRNVSAISAPPFYSTSTHHQHHQHHIHHYHYLRQQSCTTNRGCNRRLHVCIDGRCQTRSRERTTETKTITPMNISSHCFGSNRSHRCLYDRECIRDCDPNSVCIAGRCTYASGYRHRSQPDDLNRSTNITTVTSTTTAIIITTLTTSSLQAPQRGWTPLDDVIAIIVFLIIFSFAFTIVLCFAPQSHLDNHNNNNIHSISSIDSHKEESVVRIPPEPLIPPPSFNFRSFPAATSPCFSSSTTTATSSSPFDETNQIFCVAKLESQLQERNKSSPPTHVTLIDRNCVVENANPNLPKPSHISADIVEGDVDGKCLIFPYNKPHTFVVTTHAKVYKHNFENDANYENIYHNDGDE